MNRIPMMIGCLALVAGGFIAGIQFQRSGGLLDLRGHSPASNDSNWIRIEVTRIPVLPASQPAEKTVVFVEGEPMGKDIAARILVGIELSPHNLSRLKTIGERTVLKVELSALHEAGSAIEINPYADPTTPEHLAKSWSVIERRETEINGTTAALRALNSRWFALPGGRRVISIGRDAEYNHAQWEQVRTNNLEVFSSFQRELEQRGIAVHVAFVPSAASLFSDLILGERYHPTNTTPACQRVLEWEKSLAGRGVRTVNLFAPFLRERFFTHAEAQHSIMLENDSHWAPHGARVAARVIAGQIRQLHPDILAAHVVTNGAITEHVKLLEISGRYRGKPQLQSLIELPMTKTPVYRLAGEGQKGELLQQNDPTAPIWVIGDGNVAMYSSQRAGVRDHLLKELSVPVFAIYEPGAVNRRGISEFRRLGGFKHAKIVIVVAAAGYACRPWKG